MLESTDRARTEAACRAAAHVAREQGLRFDDAIILRDGSNTLVHLRPAPVVARVPALTSSVRRGGAWLTREVAVAGFLAAAGAPVVPPTTLIDPGPHRHEDRVLSFWAYVEEIDGPIDPAAAGRALRHCHEILPDYKGELPRFGVLREAESILARFIDEEAIEPADADLLRRFAARLDRRLDQLDLPLQPIHGDSHLHNVLNSPDGVLWGDWEDTFSGPTAWDLACLVANTRIFGTNQERTAAALRGYGMAIDEEALDLLVQARAFQAAVWSFVFVRQNAGSERRLRKRLRWLKQQ